MADSILGQAWASLKYVDEQFRRKCPEVYWCLVGYKVLKTADYAWEYFTRPVTKTFSVYREADCDYRFFSKGGVDSKTWYAKDGAQPIAELTVTKTDWSEFQQIKHALLSQVQSQFPGAYQVIVESDHFFR